MCVKQSIIATYKNIVYWTHKEKTLKMADSLINSSSNGSSSTVCSVFDSHAYVVAAAVSSGSAMISALCCIFVIIVIIYLKKHHSFIQRLIIYHCLAALFRALATILRLHRLGYKNQTSAINILCVISGFMSQVSAWCLIMDYSVITFTLLMIAVFHKNVASLERLYLVLIFVIPFTFNWIPFINSTYGRYGAWCWIRDRNYDDCSLYQFGITLQNVLQNVPQYVLAAVMTPIYLTVIIYIVRQKCKMRGKGSHDHDTVTLRGHLDKEVWPLFFFPFGVLLLNIVPLINGIYESVNIDQPSYALWLLTAIFTPLQGGYIALVYSVDRRTLRRLIYSIALTKRKDIEIQEYPSSTVEMTDSINSRDIEYHFIQQDSD